MGMTATHLREDLDCAEKFFNALQPTYPLWEKKPFDLVFRGHADASWPLIPTAFRPDVGAFINGKRGLQATNDEQRRFEFIALQNFWNSIDFQGLSCPEDSMKARRRWFSVFTPDVLPQDIAESEVFGSNKIGPWPPVELWSLIGLAQHHGIPTRFLNWTRSGLIAAYFAAKEILIRRNDGHPYAERLGVWACIKGFLESEGMTPNSDLALVTVPMAGNPNLRAQRGLFTLKIDKDANPRAEVDSRPFDEVLASIEPIGMMKEWLQHWAHHLYLFTLPTTEAPRLMELLDSVGVNASSLFPGYGGAADAVFEREMRRNLES